jgi:hypothetical protein
MNMAEKYTAYPHHSFLSPHWHATATDTPSNRSSNLARDNPDSATSLLLMYRIINAYRAVVRVPPPGMTDQDLGSSRQNLWGKNLKMGLKSAKPDRYIKVSLIWTFSSTCGAPHMTVCSGQKHAVHVHRVDRPLL